MFSTSFRYSLISLLALANSDELLQTNRIAQRHQLSPHYLAVILAELRRLGLVQSQKGKNGGYRLAVAPDDVNLLVLYQSLAGSQGSHPAAAEPPRSDDNSSSSRADQWLQGVWRRWAAELAATSLADLQANGSLRGEKGGEQLQVMPQE